MKTHKTLVLIGLLSLFFGCGTASKTYTANTNLDEMMSQKVFRIDVRTVEPMVTQALTQVANSGLLPPGNTVNRIDITSSGYFIKVNGDSVSANLPYYGERQMGGGYNSDTGIKFDGTTKDLEIVKDETKQSYRVGFSINNDSENLFVSTTIGTGLTSTTAIQSSHRNRIRYSGRVKKVD